MLDSIADEINKIEYKKIIVNGYTDSLGTQVYNFKLSSKRAETIANYLILKDKIPKEKIGYHGQGENDPISTNNTPEGRQKNRRVEIIIYRKD